MRARIGTPRMSEAGMSTSRIVAAIDIETFIGKGLPQARGNPAWFILPEDIADAVLEKAQALKRKEAESLLDGYRQMAADQEQEAEAGDWVEGLISDAY